MSTDIESTQDTSNAGNDTADDDSEANGAQFDPDSPYRLSPNVALRPETFGALAYHFGTRQLSFMKTPRLVTIVRELEQHSSARASLRELPESERSSYLHALAALARTGMIVPA